MKIKCGRREFEVTSKDEIMDNGACYQLVTQQYYDGSYHYAIPRVSKQLFKELKDKGKIVYVGERAGSFGMKSKYWRFVED